jgi:hypothetical protein
MSLLSNPYCPVILTRGETVIWETYKHTYILLVLHSYITTNFELHQYVQYTYVPLIAFWKAVAVDEVVSTTDEEDEDDEGDAPDADDEDGIFVRPFFLGRLP